MGSRVSTISERDLAISRIIAENERRNRENHATFNPITGEGSIGERKKVKVDDFPQPILYLPVTMLSVPLVKMIMRHKSIDKVLCELHDVGSIDDIDDYENEREAIIRQFVQIRCRHDFAFWCAMFVYIKAKGGGGDVLFVLNRPQRKLVAKLEKMRLKGKPIRLVILKARQWGGSTCVQMYMAWLQMTHEVGLNSLIIAHQSAASDKIKAMFKKMLDAYPLEMLHELGDEYDENERKMVGIGQSGSTHAIPQRNCTISIGTAISPDSSRSGDYNLVHLSEVGLWEDTDKRKAEDVMRSACSGVLYAPNTMIVEESTANGLNFFKSEYQDAKDGKSQFESLFVAWYEIELYEMKVDKLDEESKVGATEQLATWLYDNRNERGCDSNREEPGAYYWYLWNQGATLEAIYWYMLERRKYANHALMAAEYPSDDIEAFTFSGRRVFPEDDILQLRKYCKPPVFIGEIYGRGDEGEKALELVRIKEEKDGRLWVWNDVEKSNEVRVLYRYLVVVDVCKGKTERADYSVITVFDRLNMIDGDRPCVVAQWYGHIDMDKLAWKAAQVAHYYDDALLVIESNTLETNNTKGDAEYILNLVREEYDNLYARKQSEEDIKEGAPRKYGWHTNVATKIKAIRNLQACVRDVLYTERDERCLGEMQTYIENERGTMEAMSGFHDDLLMTRAIGLYVCFYEMEMPKIVELKKKRTPKQKVVSAATI